MSKFIALVIAANACGAVVLAVVLSTSRPESPKPHVHHGDFTSRLQPQLDGIGSTRDLAPVALSGRHGGSPRQAQPQP
jgi:hypothetical protein